MRTRPEITPYLSPFPLVYVGTFVRPLIMYQHKTKIHIFPCYFAPVFVSVCYYDTQRTNTQHKQRAKIPANLHPKNAQNRKRYIYKI